ncbi:unnamed protein product [Staurois parvus]|uniref:Uncharacterized protein n=1 Tax=Staurois parvus TaxID=386267 RepID=A0ABN9C7B3_9NEOB|nr:unnamed protein product [Staurois parvus]
MGPPTDLGQCPSFQMVSSPLDIGCAQDALISQIVYKHRQLLGQHCICSQINLA